MRQPDEPEINIVTCRLVSDALMAKIAARYAADTGEAAPDFAVYPGSIKQPCSICTKEVWVGPRQQASLEDNPEAIVACMLCARSAMRLIQQSGNELGVVSLGNPYKRADRKQDIDTPDTNRGIPEFYRRRT